MRLRRPFVITAIAVTALTTVGAVTAVSADAARRHWYPHRPVVKPHRPPTAPPTVTSTWTTPSTTAPTTTRTTAPVPTVSTTSVPTVSTTSVPTVSTTSVPTVSTTSAPASSSTSAPASSSTSAPASSSTSSSGAPARFSTLAPGAALPSGAQCAAWVKSAPVPAEVKGVNAAYNARTGKTLSGATGLDARIDGNFTGTTEQVLRWAACKWGVDEDVVKAQAAVESWWRMDTKGDLGSDASRCAPGHGLGVDGTAGQCPESWGLLQIRYPYNQSAFPEATTSSAFNADYAYARFRACYTGEYTWLNDVERTGTYAAGDQWGCLGVWFSGRWHTSAAEGYITRVKGYLDQRIWTTKDFAQP